MIKFCFENIYSRLGDEESRFLFKERLHYSLTGDRRQMINAMSKKTFVRLNERRCIYEKQYSNKKCFLFGAGISSREAVYNLNEIPWQAFIDNDNTKIGKPDILPIISFQDFIENSGDSIVFITSSLYGIEMKQQLIDSGFPEKSIVDLYLAFAQYFDLPYFKPQDKEFFIDVGGYDGTTTKDFFRWSEGWSKSIIFEANIASYEMCKNNIKKWGYGNAVKIVNKGLWHKSETLKFHIHGKSDSSCITHNGEDIIDAITLDEYLKDEKEPITFIKMDIEGAELNALKGAERIIRKQKPRLAISIYHKPEDIWEIPSLLLDYVSDYKFYIRHYHFTANETVLYASLN